MALVTFLGWVSQVPIYPYDGNSKWKIKHLSLHMVTPVDIREQVSNQEYVASAFLKPRHPTQMPPTCPSVIRRLGAIGLYPLSGKNLILGKELWLVHRGLTIPDYVKSLAMP